MAVLDVCVQKCDSRFHQEIGKFRFLNEMIKIVSPKYLGNLTTDNVKNKTARFVLGLVVKSFGSWVFQLSCMRFVSFFFPSCPNRWHHFQAYVLVDENAAFRAKDRRSVQHAEAPRHYRRRSGARGSRRGGATSATARRHAFQGRGKTEGWRD